MLSLLGIPLTAGFMGKLTIFGEVLDSRGDYLWLVIVAVVNSVISAWYYLRVILVAYMQDESAQKPIRLVSSRPLALSVGLAAAATVIVGLLPSKALGVSTRAGMSLARLEGSIAIARFLERFPRYELSGTPTRGGRARFRGFLKIPCRVEP